MWRLWRSPSRKARPRCKTHSMLLTKRWSLGFQINKGTIWRYVGPLRTDDGAPTGEGAATCETQQAAVTSFGWSHSQGKLRRRTNLESDANLESDSNRDLDDPIRTRTKLQDGTSRLGERSSGSPEILSPYVLWRDATTLAERWHEGSHQRVSSLHIRGDAGSTILQVEVAKCRDLWRNLWSRGPHQILFDICKPLFWRGHEGRFNHDRGWGRDRHGP